jgi:2-oxoglutarate/2-oxoacid ferredoxin oxidoreductase subunit alpha
MARQTLSLVFAGSGGSGAMTAGALFLHAAASAGYYGVMTQLFGAQVRGGESAALVQISITPVEAQPDYYDVFFALDWKKVDQFAPEIPLSESSVVVADPSAGPLPVSIAKSKPKLRVVSYDDSGETRLEHALQGSHVNVVAASLAAALVGIKRELFEAAANALFSEKTPRVIASNLKAIGAGFSKAAAIGLTFTMERPAPGQRWLITGNQAVAFGALRGGVRFVGCYPITPATDLVEWLAPRIRDLGGTLVLAEDELASINMVLGASYGGTPSMTVTAGPGLALMTEAIGLGVAAEIPALVVDVMRAGPSTGIASKTEQSDLNIAIYGGHGDAPRIVVAPLSVADCLTTAEWAVYLAESLQTPVLLLSDQMLGQARAALPAPSVRPLPRKRRTNGVTAPANFKRYAIGPDAITPMPMPGTKGYEWVAEGLTHNEAGLPVSGAAAHSAQLNKRAKKFSQFDPGSLWGEVYGEGDTAIITFGSSVAPAREAATRLTKAGRPTRVVALRVLSPVPRALAGALKGAKRVAVLEQNQSGQLFHHLLANRAIPTASESIARCGPLPFRPAEITAHLA